MVNTVLIDLLRSYKKYPLLSIAALGEHADMEQCELAACIFNIYARNTREIKFFPTDSETPIESLHDLLGHGTNRRAVDVASALKTAQQWFGGQKYHAKKVLFVLSKSPMPREAVDRLKQLQVDIILLTRTSDPRLPLPSRSAIMADQWFHVDANQFYYLNEYASQRTAHVELVPDLTSPNTLALHITGCDSAHSFIVQVSEDRSVMWYPMDVSSRTLTVQNLTPGHTYCVRVRAVTTEAWLTEYSEVFRFTLPTAIDVTPLLRQPKPKKQLESSYRKLEQVLCDLPGQRLTLVVQGNKREEFIRVLQSTLPASKSKNKSAFKICFAANQSETVGTYYTVLAIDPACNTHSLLSQFNAVERVPWPLYIMLLVNSRTCCTLSESFVNRLCDMFRITRDHIIAVREDDAKQTLLQLLVDIMNTLALTANENPALFDIPNDAAVVTSHGSLWDLFDKYKNDGEALDDPSTLFKSIQWHPPY
eukprot:TRINITY_DN4334_c0_g1_i1.p1 TRINITY_DN4334_c0_g1~~TRINITY_DN4334_c0_g1_i1.p1  ORF type:complete len:478 (+),score=63.36 TRINITY_DN4334_c0_g1_i1:228-1661(+)